ICLIQVNRSSSDDENSGNNLISIKEDESCSFIIGNLGIIIKKYFICIDKRNSIKDYWKPCSAILQSAIFLNLRKDKRLSAREHLAVFLWFGGHEGTSLRPYQIDLNISTSTVRCIDGTHITIDPPLNLKNQYIDRKGNVSICMQGICNEKKKFISIFVGYPGSSHDSWIYQNSPIFNRINSYCGDYYLLGDSAYPCSKHLVTPYRDNGHLTNIQKTFNIKLSSARVSMNID
ncbi:Protein ALP1-like, partial [Lucilia cuprina]